MVYKKITNDCYASNPSLTDKHELIWKKGQFTPFFLVIKAPASVRISIDSPEFKRALEEAEEQLVKKGKADLPDFTRTEIFVKQSSEFERIRNQCKFQIGTGNLQYWIFAAGVEDNQLILYVYNNIDEVLPNQVTLSSCIKVKMTNVVKNVRKFIFWSVKHEYRKVIVETHDAYQDGDLYYIVDQYEYPVLFDMLNRPFYLNISSGKKVVFKSRQDAKIDIEEA